MGSYLSVEENEGEPGATEEPSEGTYVAPPEGAPTNTEGFIKTGPTIATVASEEEFVSTFGGEEEKAEVSAFLNEADNENAEGIAEDENQEMAVEDDYTRRTSAVGNHFMYEDHFSLPTKSSLIRFRNGRSTARVVQGTAAQLILEDRYNPKTRQEEFMLKRMKDTTGGLRFLRTTYTLVCALFTCFLFTFSIQVLLFVMMDTAIEFGVSDRQVAEIPIGIGVLLSIPGFIFALANLLVLAGSFLVDTWKGHPLVKNFVFTTTNDTLLEWIFFWFFLGVPVVTMGISLLVGTDKWWEITVMVWFCDIAYFYAFFSLKVIYYELQAEIKVMRDMRDDDDDRLLAVCMRSILMKQQQAYSGLKTTSFLSFGDVLEGEEGPEKYEEIEGTKHTTSSMLSLCTELLVKMGLYEELETPALVHQLEDVRDERPYVTNTSWGLEKLFCRPSKSRYIAILKGPGRITRLQLRSTIVCSLLGIAMIGLLLVGMMVYLDITGALLAVWVILVGVGALVVSTGPIRQLRTLRQIDYIKNEGELFTSCDREGGQVDEEVFTSQGIFHVTERHRVNSPKEMTRWILFGVEVGLFFIWPIWSLFYLKNYPMAFLFIVLVGINGIRYYVNAGVVLEETGTMRFVTGTDKASTWAHQARLNEIVGNITRGDGLTVWSIVLGTFAFTFLLIAGSAIGSDVTGTFTELYNFLPTDFSYPGYPEGTLQYPTCVLGELENRAMADYVYLAGLAYRPTNITQDALDSWFGAGNAVDNFDIVDDFRTSTDNYTSAVVYKYVTLDGISLVVVRGTTTMWDMLADAQLWSAAVLMQGLRIMLPFGHVFTPVFHHLVYGITLLQSSSIEKVSFYKKTDAFVSHLKDDIKVDNIQLTGHSLGGGLAIITGALQKVPAVALSGPNAMISRKTFGISSEDINRYSFNIIPDRDVVPMIDDPAQLTQSIRCLTEQYDLAGCHDSTRALCEVLYMCGNGDRPIPCECVTTYAYPKPDVIGNNMTLSFEEICEI